MVQSSQLWMKYNPHVDSLTIYFTGQPMPSLWTDVDEYIYIGYALEDETYVIGVMTDHFSKWLAEYLGQIPLQNKNLEGIWQNVGFEKIVSLEAEIQTVKQELQDNILKRVL